MRTIRINGLSPRPKLAQRLCQLRPDPLKDEDDIHVSHKMGNSLCSHPALLMSDFGGICVVLRMQVRELRKVEVSVCRDLSLALARGGRSS